MNISLSPFLPYLTAFSTFLVIWACLYFAQKYLVRYLKKRAKRTEGDIDDACVNVVATIHPLVLGAASLALSLRFFDVSAVVYEFFFGVFLAGAVYQVAVSASALIDVVIQKRQGKKVRAGERSALSFVSTAAKWGIGVMGALLILSNFGINITSLVAGLGIGGIAVAFALQNILSDLFSSLAIYLDKPFEIGDFIVVGTYMGTVEKIGIKTTRLRALQGEEIVISNAELTTSRIQNFKKMNQRRVVVQLGVSYETPQSVLREIPLVVREVVEGTENARFDRVHLTSFGDFSIVFELVYFVPSGEYTVYADTNQHILFSIKDAFDAKHISFAFPSQTIYLKKEG